jgi:hypothetical protein
MANSIDPLDRALAAMPQDVDPPRDLWAGIAAEIEREDASVPRSRWRMDGWMQLAAGVLLVVGSSLTTYWLVRQPQVTAPTAQTAATTPAHEAFNPQQQLGPKYISARTDLERTFNQRVATLPPAARAKVEANLAEIRRAASEVTQILAQHPSDPLLQELLVSTYQSELQLFADVSAMTQRAPKRT